MKCYKGLLSAAEMISHSNQIKSYPWLFLMQEILKWLGIEFAWVLWVPWDKASVGKLPFIEDSVPNRQHPGKIQVEHSCLIL